MAVRQHPQPPLLTSHARDRFRERAAAADVDAWTAWTDGVPVALPDPYDIGDEYRYHAHEQVVLCRRDSDITTAYDLTGADADARVRAAVEHQLDVTLEDET